MKKRLKFGVILAALVFAFSALAGCGKATEISTYQGENKDTLTGNSLYDKELFYRNDFFAESADPFVLDDTARSGYYYMYRTGNRLYALRSKNLTDWEPIGNTLSIKNGVLTDKAYTVSNEIANTAIWASEVIFDADEEKYYAFFSATPRLTEAEKKQFEMYNLLVAVSDSPEGPFELVSFRDEAAVEGGYYHDYNVTAGKTEVTENSTELLDSNGEVYAYPQKYAEYCYIDPQAGRYYYEQNEGIGVGGNRLNDTLRANGFAQGIDPSPFVAPNGDKYLYWVVDLADGYANRVYGVKMKTDENGKSSWLNPDFSTMKLLTIHGYYTIEDFLKANHPAEGEEAAVVDRVDYEYAASVCNEGPCMVEHNGKYYLTYSANGWGQSSYCVVQAVSDSPIGPFRKLTQAENAVIISSDGGASPKTAGPGHHCFMTVGSKNYIGYHKHRDYTYMGTRGYSIDEIKWITITDKDGNPLDVMYANGPTISVQPQIYGEYANVAEGLTANVKKGKLVDGSSVSSLTDGLLSMNTIINAAFNDKYIKETEIKQTTTFEFDLGGMKELRAVMIYNSKDPNRAFFECSAEFVGVDENGKEQTYAISKIAFDTDEYANVVEVDGVKRLTSIVHGASAYAEFAAINAKKVRITVSVPSGQTSVGISEIRILGK